MVSLMIGDDDFSLSLLEAKPRSHYLQRTCSLTIHSHKS